MISGTWDVVEGSTGRIKGDMDGSRKSVVEWEVRMEVEDCNDFLWHVGMGEWLRSVTGCVLELVLK